MDRPATRGPVSPAQGARPGPARAGAAAPLASRAASSASLQARLVVPDLARLASISGAGGVPAWAAVRLIDRQRRGSIARSRMDLGATPQVRGRTVIARPAAVHGRHRTAGQGGRVGDRHADLDLTPDPAHVHRIAVAHPSLDHRGRRTARVPPTDLGRRTGSNRRTARDRRPANVPGNPVRLRPDGRIQGPRCRHRIYWAPMRSSSPAGDPSRKSSQPVDRPSACWSSRSGGMRWSNSSCTQHGCASRSSRSRVDR